MPAGPHFQEPVAVSAKEFKKAKRGSHSERGRTQSTKYNTIELTNKLKKISQCYDIKPARSGCLCGGYTPKMSAQNKYPLRPTSPERDFCPCKDNSITEQKYDGKKFSYVIVHLN
jgi:hypothetical protein